MENRQIYQHIHFTHIILPVRLYKTFQGFSGTLGMLEKINGCTEHARKLWLNTLGWHFSINHAD